VATATQARLLTPAQIGRLCPQNREGVSVSPTSVVRWITEGVRLRSGDRLKLPAVRYPAGWRIAEDDFEQFIARLTADRTGEAASPITAARAEQSIARLQGEGW
jgi:hypothetical protein